MKTAEEFLKSKGLNPDLSEHQQTIDLMESYAKQRAVEFFDEMLNTGEANLHIPRWDEEKFKSLYDTFIKS